LRLFRNPTCFKVKHKIFPDEEIARESIRVQSREPMISIECASVWNPMLIGFFLLRIHLESDAYPIYFDAHPILGQEFKDYKTGEDL